MKRIILMIVCIVTFSSSVLAMENEPTSFHDLQFGTSLEKSSNTMALFSVAAETEKYYIKTDEILLFGKTPANSIKYLFVDDIFTGGIIDFFGKENCEEVLEHLKEIHGPADKTASSKISESYKWIGESMMITAVYTFDTTFYGKEKLVLTLKKMTPEALKKELPVSKEKTTLSK